MECRPGGEINRRSPVVGHEGPQPKVPDGQLPVGRTRRVPGAVTSQGRGRHGDLFGQPADERSGQIIAVQPTLAGVTKKRDMKSPIQAGFQRFSACRSDPDRHRPERNSVPAMPPAFLGHAMASRHLVSASVRETLFGVLSDTGRRTARPATVTSSVMPGSRLRHRMPPASRIGYGRPAPFACSST